MTEKAIIVFEKIALKIPFRYSSKTPSQMAKELTAHLSKKEKLTKEKEYLQRFQNNAGVVFKHPITKQDVMWISPKVTKLPRVQQRAIIAHEAYHLKGPPLLKNFESLASLYGGSRSGAGMFKKFGPFSEYAHMWKTQPKEALIEHSIPLLMAGGILSLTKAIQESKKKKEN